MNRMDIALRSYVQEKKQKPKSVYPQQPDYVLYDRMMVFDTETTTDQYQNLTFGSFQIYENGLLQFQGLFYGEILTDDQIEVLRSFSSENGIPLYTHSKFIDDVFYREVYEFHSLCIGFNLPFDLSRLAVHFGNSKGRNKGGFSFQLSDNPFNPWIVVKHIDSTKAFISFNNAKNTERGNLRHRKGRTDRYRGRFLDLRTLSFSLTNRKHSLDSACKRFDCEIQKTIAESHGKVTPDYIRYNINDVEATYHLYIKLKNEYARYNLDTPIHKIYSPASLGKGYLKKMGIQSFFDKNPDFPPEILGYVMTTYYGGRSEVRVRKQPTQISYIDVLSMYPTVNILQRLWDFVICDHIEWNEATQEVNEFLEGIDLEALSNQETWKQLRGICLVDSDEDILPVRAHYGEKNVFNIGLNYLSSEVPVWYSLSDVIASKLLTGKIPKVKRAIRFDPVGIQDSLLEIEILNDIHFSPKSQDLFKVLIEERKQLKDRKLDPEQLILKIITNSTSYGIFVEINTSEKSETDLDIFGLDKFETIKNKIEENGSMFNPIMGAFITSGARLILAITERILMNHGEPYAFCDTDSMAVPVERVNEIQEYFKDLNPYSFEADIFEMEKENFNEETGDPEPLWFYGISAKRYVLFNLREDEIKIRKFSSHGLGHLLNPFTHGNKSEWHHKVWEDILSIEYGNNTLEDVLEQYHNKYAISQLSISSPEIMKRMKVLNHGKDYFHQVKPFNFAIVGTARENRLHTLEDIKPFIPYTKRYHEAPHKPFIDYHTGEWMKGIQYWKSMEDVFWGYYIHPESKFDGSIGKLDRKHIHVGEIIHIGKESNKLEQSNVLGVGKDGYEFFENGEIDISDDMKDLILLMSPIMAEECGIEQSVTANLILPNFAN